MELFSEIQQIGSQRFKTVVTESVRNGDVLRKLAHDGRNIFIVFHQD